MQYCVTRTKIIIFSGPSYRLNRLILIKISIPHDTAPSDSNFEKIKSTERPNKNLLRKENDVMFKEKLVLSAFQNLKNSENIYSYFQFLIA